jgi:hypothetical protein
MYVEASGTTAQVKGVDPSDGRSYRLQTVDVQTSLIHSRPGYDDEAGVGAPGDRFFAAVR